MSSGRNRKGKKRILYPDLQSAIRPVAHSSEIPIPLPPSGTTDDDTESSMSSDEHESQEDCYAQQSEIDKSPQLITQSKLNDLVRDLSLTKQQSELLASRLQEWNLLDENTRITEFRNRSNYI